MLQYALLVAVTSHRLFLPPPVDPKQLKLPLTTLYEAELQPSLDVCKSLAAFQNQEEPMSMAFYQVKGISQSLHLWIENMSD